MFFHIYSCFLNKIYISNSIILINFLKNLKENIIKFIKNVNENYNGIDLIITYCDIENIKNDVNEIINNISIVCYSVEPAIKMKVYGETILRDLFLYSEIFFREKNCIVKKKKKMMIKYY